MARPGQRLRNFACSPTFTVKPSISGIPKVGQTLTGASGAILNGTVSGRQWKRGGVAIIGATEATYVPQAADVGAALTFEVVVTNALRSTNITKATSAATAAVAA
ncbi:hypothetical protein [uncultured Sphingomonas sp.]|uniref:hypothetical protein n=1 Tax=uncultured Sphingomonas sp. TaxID=158754 RepID=UPI0025E77A4D|nr:hypothetical protein [uncultured Sphingomonas sp.]